MSIRLLSEMGPAEIFALEPANEREGVGYAALVGDLATMSQLEQGPVTRIHSRCLRGDVLGLAECDCGPQLEAARSTIRAEGQGILMYLDGQEGRGAGFQKKEQALALMAKHGITSAEAYRCLGIPYDQREYGHCARFLLEHGIGAIRLLTNNPAKIALRGIAVTRTKLVAGVNPDNRDYLLSKIAAGHLLTREDLEIPV